MQRRIRVLALALGLTGLIVSVLYISQPSAAHDAAPISTTHVAAAPTPAQPTLTPTQRSFVAWWEANGRPYIDWHKVAEWSFTVAYNRWRASLPTPRTVTVHRYASNVQVHHLQTPAPTGFMPAFLGNATGSVNGMPCGGSLPSCCTLTHESNGSPTARNPSGAAGLWQVMPGTWKGYGGYASAADAPVAVQNAFAAQLYAGGAGASNWFGDGCYGGR